MNTPQRKSFAAIGIIYFWTATVHNWYHLFSSESNKKIITRYLKKLSDDGLITVYAFVLMPNHIHLIWQQHKMNGKETPFGSFLKYTAHILLRELKLTDSATKYKVEVSNKQYEVWKRDSLSVEIYSREVAIQKINYIHTNPVTGKWNLAKDDISYFYSSAEFYETGKNDFGFLKDLFLEFDGE
ncbi:MAG: transposase [Ferruginibacter sp.]